MKQKHSLKQYALLTVLLLSGLFSASAEKYAAKFICDYDYSQLKFTVTKLVAEPLEDETTVTGEIYDTPSITGKVVIPSTIDYYGMILKFNGIDDNAFADQNSFTELVLPSTDVNYDFTEAVLPCAKLERITVEPGNDDNIYESTDDGTCIYRRDTVKTLMWVGCGVTSYYFNVAVQLDANPSVFYNATAMESVTVNEHNPFIKAVDNVIYSIDGKKLLQALQCVETLDIPKSVTTVCNTFIRSDNNIKTLTLRSSIDKIPDVFFNLEYLDILGNCRQINDNAFSNLKNIKEVSINTSGSLSIGKDAFSNCDALTTVSMNTTGRELLFGKRAFSNCSALTTVSLNTIGELIFEDRAFSNCSALTTVDIQNSRNTTINDYTFSDCASLANFNLPYSPTRLDSYCFISTPSLKELTIPRLDYHYEYNNINIGVEVLNLGFDTSDFPETFSHPLGSDIYINADNLKELNLISESIAVIPVIHAPELETVTVSDRYHGIRNEAFIHCPKLRHFTGNAVETIGASAFRGTSFDLAQMPPNITFFGEHSFANLSGVSEQLVYDIAYKTIYAGTFGGSVKNFKFLPPENPYNYENTGGELRPIYYAYPAIYPNAFALRDVETTTLGENVVWTNATILPTSQNLVILNKEQAVSVLTLNFPLYPEFIEDDMDFSDDEYDNTILWVPDNLINTYRQSQIWCKFKNIRPLSEYSGVEDVTADGNGLEVEVADGVVTVNSEESQSVEIYSLDGKRVTAGMTGQPLNVGKGLHIIRCGSAAKKVMVK